MAQYQEQPPPQQQQGGQPLLVPKLPGKAKSTTRRKCWRPRLLVLVLVGFGLVLSLPRFQDFRRMKFKITITATTKTRNITATAAAGGASSSSLEEMAAATAAAKVRMENNNGVVATTTTAATEKGGAVENAGGVATMAATTASNNNENSPTAKAAEEIAVTAAEEEIATTAPASDDNTATAAEKIPQQEVVLSRAEKRKRERKQKAAPATIQATGNNSSNTGQQRTFTHAFQLKVPFYVYNHDLLDWSNATIENCPTSRHAKRKRFDTLNEFWYKGGKGTEPLWKHMDDYWFYQAAMQHPMRTDDPHKAKLFFVPTMMNAFGTSEYQRCDLCLPNPRRMFGEPPLLCSHDLLRAASSALEQSPTFSKHQGRDHFFIDSHWRSNFQMDNLTTTASALFHCNRITFENGKVPNKHEDEDHKATGRFTLQSMYVGNPCPEPISDYAKKVFDFTFVGNPGSLRKQAFAYRRRLCRWVEEERRSGHPKYTFSNCGLGSMCPTLPMAKYGFHIRGDTWGANRLMDILLSRTVPIFTAEEQYAILPDFVPWRDLGYFLPIPHRDNGKEKFDQGMLELLNNSPEEYKRKQDLIDKWYHVLDHRQPYQFDAYMNRLAEMIGLYDNKK